MKATILQKVVVILCVGNAPALLGQSFNSGSNGTNGALNVTSNTVVDLPPDGILHYTTINVASGATLRFNRNALNTPVYLLAQSNIVIAGTIDVSGSSSGAYTGLPDSVPGLGGPGGFDGGYGQYQNFAASDGQGPGGGRATGYHGGVFAFPLGGNTNNYGNTLLSPLVGGSGSAGGNNAGPYGGGGGGGAVLIASTTRVTVTGAVNANGGTRGGSGGAIRIVSPVVDGTGVIQAAGNSFQVFEGGSQGRVRIDTLDRLAWRGFNLSAAGKMTIGSRMVVFSDGPEPKLDILNVGGSAIPVGTNASVVINLPIGSPTNQPVTVRASNFTNDILITVAITPESGPSARFYTVITYAGPVSTGAMNVVIPVDTLSRIHVWTR